MTWKDAWQDSMFVRFWRMTKIRDAFLISAAVMLFGMAGCGVMIVLGNKKTGMLYDSLLTLAMVGDLGFVLSFCAFCVMDVYCDIRRRLK